MACLQELLKGGAPAMDSARRHARSAVRAVWTVLYLRDRVAIY